MKENLKEELTKEAIKRLNILSKKYNLNPVILENYQKDGMVYYSEDTVLGKKSKIEELSNNTQFLEIVKRFEEENNAIAYHCISIPKHLLGELSFLGSLLNILYIAKGRNKDSKGFNTLLEHNCMDTYTYNLDIEDFSEFGQISLIGVDGALSRKDVQDMIANHGMPQLFVGM